MRGLTQNKQRAYLIAFAVFVALGLLLWILVLRHESGSWLVTAYEKGVRKIELVSTMRANLLMSAEAEKSSVMADTDAESRAYADQSIKAAAAVEEARRALLPLIDEKAGQELQSFQQFSTCWEKLQELDRQILSLAVQNTNLKAMQLSFVSAREAIDRMESAMNQLMDASSSSPHALEITRTASTAMIDALNIYTLHAPHIAETSDQQMDSIESAMKGQDEKVNKALKDLDGLVTEAGRPFLDKVKASYDDFRKVHDQVIQLSRQNSNIRSFSISLGQKRNVTAQCLDSLAALEQAVRENTTFRATR